MISTLNELGEKYGYTTKSYNLLAILLMLKQDIDRAIKIFESALSDLKLNQPEGESSSLYAGNNDLASLLVNYIKCSAIRDGVGQSSDVFKTDEHYKRLFEYLSIVSKGMADEFFDQRKKAGAMFEQALKQV